MKTKHYVATTKRIEAADYPRAPLHRAVIHVVIADDVERTVHTVTKSVTLDELADYANTQLGTMHVDPGTVRLIGRGPIPQDESEFATQYSVCLDVDGNEPVAGIPPQWTFDDARAAALAALRADPSLPSVRIRSELARDNGSPVLFRITVSGVAGPSGTVPMDMRSNALTAASKMILAIEQAAVELHPEIRVTGVELTVENRRPTSSPGWRDSRSI